MLTVKKPYSCRKCGGSDYIPRVASRSNGAKYLQRNCKKCRTEYMAVYIKKWRAEKKGKK